MADSILDDVKAVLGVDASVTAFDTDIIMHINSVFATLHQVGAAPQDLVFVIEDNTAKWADFIQGVNQINMVKSYIYVKVRLLFDPPQNSFGINNLKEVAKEYEWRLNQLEDLFVTTEGA